MLFAPREHPIAIDYLEIGGNREEKKNAGPINLIQNGQMRKLLAQAFD